MAQKQIAAQTGTTAPKCTKENQRSAEIVLKEGSLPIREYLALRESVGWVRLSDQQATAAMANCLYCVSAWDGDKPVGMGRLVGDGAVIVYVQDLVIRPEYQSMGIGSLLIEDLIAYAESLREPGTTLMLDLMCAKGRERFYSSHGFLARPTDRLGPGMIRYLKDEV